MKILSLADVISDVVYSPKIAERFAGVDLALGCGDLPYHYMEFVISGLNTPLYYVRGNHSKPVENSDAGPLTHPQGGIDLHRRVRNYKGLLLAGVEGCQRYRNGPYQYSQAQMWLHAGALIPGLIANRARFGRYLDVFVTHAPPWGIHDDTDWPHHGIHAFRWLLRIFRPAYHFHGHVHIYRPDTIRETQFGKTTIINTFGYRVTELWTTSKT